LHEGWNDDYHFSGSPHERIQSRKNRYLGTSSMSYAVMKRDILVNVSQFVLSNQRDFSYLGFEKLLNVGQLAMGEVLSIPDPIYLRDRTFVDRSTNESDWSDPEKDAQVNNVIADFLHADLGLYESRKIALDALEELPSLRYDSRDRTLLEVRQFMDKAQPDTSVYLSRNLDSVTYSLARKAWKDSARSAFAGQSLSLLGLKTSYAGKLAQRLKLIVKSIGDAVRYP